MQSLLRNERQLLALGISVPSQSFMYPACYSCLSSLQNRQPVKSSNDTLAYICKCRYITNASQVRYRSFLRLVVAVRDQLYQVTLFNNWSEKLLQINTSSLVEMLRDPVAPVDVLSVPPLNAIHQVRTPLARAVVNQWLILDTNAPRPNASKHDIIATTCAPVSSSSTDQDPWEETVVTSVHDTSALTSSPFVWRAASNSLSDQMNNKKLEEEGMLALDTTLDPDDLLRQMTKRYAGSNASILSYITEPSQKATVEDIHQITEMVSYLNLLDADDTFWNDD
ncbi:hypothetical protein BDF22DRAFT_703204 [Syncephalis plumigaleata]|nr:hypothetical protein BDF22DRAFT_703204 [Syncephalis plumigaleata]